jgi:hypothetical protein
MGHMNAWRERDEAQKEICSRYFAKSHGFRRSLMELVLDEANFDLDEAKFLFGEYFGDLTTIPLAFKVIKDKRERRAYIHVYEKNLSPNKLAQYARIADGDGPNITVYVLDRFNKIRSALDNDELAIADSDENYRPRHRRLTAEERTIVKIDADELNSLRIEARSLRDELSKLRASKIKSTRSDERAILRAVQELGLIKEGDIL